jgi:hypothetical protein
MWGVLATFSRFIEGFERFMVVFLTQMYHLGSELLPNLFYVNAEPEVSFNLTVL